MESTFSQRRGFTLVELLVVIAIIGILVAMLLPAVQAAREAARRMSCGNQLKQIGIALHNYHDTYKSFPPDAIWFGNPRGTTCTAQDVRHYTWITMILPFIEQAPLHDQIDFRLPGLNQMVAGGPAGANVPFQSIMLDFLQCPSDTPFPEVPHGFGYTSYAGSKGWDGHRRFYGDTKRSGMFPFMDNVRIRDVLDGTSNTVMVGEVTTGAYCRSTNPASTCYTGPADPRWQGGGGKLRQQTSRVFRSALIAPSPRVSSHAWITAAGKGDALRADGSAGAYWGPWSGPYAGMPTYEHHYAMNVEWPGPASVHPGGAQFCLADASVRFVPETISTGEASANRTITGGTTGNLGAFGNVWIAIHTIAGNAQSADSEAPVEWP